MSMTPAQNSPATPESGLVDSLWQHLRNRRRSADSVADAARQARLEAMRFAPPPSDPRRALRRAEEAAREAREARAAGGEDAASAEAAESAGQAARLEIARLRRAVKPGSREDRDMAGLRTGGIDLVV